MCIFYDCNYYANMPVSTAKNQILDLFISISEENQGKTKQEATPRRPGAHLSLLFISAPTDFLTCRVVFRVGGMATETRENTSPQSVNHSKTCLCGTIFLLTSDRKHTVEAIKRSSVNLGIRYFRAAELSWFLASSFQKIPLLLAENHNFGSL